MSVTITEVIRRANQGMTRPYICRGDDGEVYFVKGKGAGRRSQICEWIGGRLGLELGLPLAPFRIVEVPDELVASSASLNLADLGSGPAFGSLRQDIMDLPASRVDEVPVELQRDVLLFDWWIHNNDRILTQRGGNPNLFWEPETHELIVFDHNQACDRSFDPTEFFKYHAFRGRAAEIFNDLVRRQQYTNRLGRALGQWQEICDSLPHAWFYADPERTVPADFDRDATLALLRRYEQNDFWKIP